MKGFSGFKTSPMKVSDSQVIHAQDKLDQVEMGWKTPGWATALDKVFGKKDKPEKVETKTPQSSVQANANKKRLATPEENAADAAYYGSEEDIKLNDPSKELNKITKPL